MSAIRVGLFVMIFACGCSPHAPQPILGQPGHLAQFPVPFPDQHEADQRLTMRFPAEMAALGEGGANIDAEGLLNENRMWGGLYSPRFQMDSGTALRMGVVLENADMARAGFFAIDAASSAIGPDGEVVSRLPVDRFPGAKVSRADQASGAAFFLADACSGMLAAGSHLPDDITEEDWQRVVSALGRATAWLDTQHSLLERVDANAPNRLFFDALAFQACGQLTGQPTSRASRFVALALAKARADGVFEEGGGSDTTYQAVSVRVSLAVLLAGYEGADTEALWQANIAGAHWLAERVRADGSVDSSQNTRTCAGGETFMGREKKLSLKTVFQALAYSGALAEDDQLIESATRVSAWASSNPRSDSCL
jgi:hypothetical protein